MSMRSMIRNVIAMILACTMMPLSLWAQTAPEGNAHPKVNEVSDVRELSNPFGAPQPSTFDTEQKAAFSKVINLEPLRTLAVQHGGRIKILDTLARETVRELMGRRDYVDISVDPVNPNVARNTHFDPLFTLMDLSIDPLYYADRPLIHVEFLTLRREMVERMYTGKAEQEWWLRVGRLKPARIVEVFDPIADKFGFEAGFPKALNNVRSAMQLYQDSWKNLQLVAADAPDKPWQHLAALSPSDHPLAAQAVQDLASAWRARDVAKTNAAITTLSQELPKINAAYYPTTRRTLEGAYNKVNAFEWGYWLYALSLLSLLLAFGTARRWLVVLGLTTLGLAVAMHAFGFVSRCLIAERFAIQNQFESMTGLSLFATLVGSAVMLIKRQWLFGAAAAGVGFMVLITATQTAIPGMNVEREAPILNTSVLLKYHVTTVLVSYGLIALGFMVSLFYLFTHYAARARSKRVALAGGASTQMDDLSAAALNLPEDQRASHQRVLSDLDKAQMTILQLAFWTLGVGILLGAWWADHSWGRWWAFDPKETWALITWIVYLIVIHVRFTQLKDRGLTTAWLSIVGFVIMLWTYFGVNLLLAGLHAYA